MDPQTPMELAGGLSLPGAESDMARHEITRLPVDQFHYRQFRYLNLEDAVAQAKRDGAAVSDTVLPVADAELAEYGISRVSMDYLHYRQYQYTNLKDALAQAKWAEQKNLK